MILFINATCEEWPIVINILAILVDDLDDELLLLDKAWIRLVHDHLPIVGDGVVRGGEVHLRLLGVLDAEVREGARHDDPEHEDRNPGRDDAVLELSLY